VQGVGFRYYVLGEAGNLGLTGWVRNRMDGSVEALAEGDKEGLEALIRALKRGSSSSLVHDVQVDWLEATDEFERFFVRGTI
jgi:acylphosphatase